jgi:hypothetical protein
VDLKRRGHGGSRARVIINRQQEEEMMYVCPSPINFVIYLNWMYLSFLVFFCRNIGSNNIDR